MGRRLKLKRIHLVVAVTGIFLLGIALASVTEINNLFYPTGKVGDTENIYFDGSSPVTGIKGSNSITITYTGDTSAGICWQTRDNKMEDLSDVRKLIFWAKGLKGGEQGVAIVGGPNDSNITRIIIPDIPSNWKRYEIELSNSDLSRISWGFSFMLTRKGTIYLDNIYYEL